MADIVLPSGIGRTEFTIDAWAPGQTDVTAPYRPALEAAGPVASGWRGTVGLKPKNPEGDPTLDRPMLALKARLRGNRHRLRLPLPRAYHGVTPPPGARAFLTTATLDGESVLVSYSAQNWGDWTPTAGAFCNVGDRLYLLDAIEGAALRMIPAVLPLAEVRKPGIHPTPGGGAPVPDAPFTGQGLGVYRGALYESHFSEMGSGMVVFWSDPNTGTRREVLRTPGAFLDSLAGIGDGFYATHRVHAGQTLTHSIAKLDIDLADPSRNTATPILTLTSVPGDRLAGLCEWSVPGSRDVHVYLGVRGTTTLFRSRRPLPGRPTTAPFATWFEPVAGPTGFSNVRGLAPGEGPDAPLYLLDTSLNTIYTWDGTIQRAFASGTVGQQAGANALQVTHCFAIEWYRGRLLVLHDTVGTTNKGLARVNYDVTAQDTRIRGFTTPFVMARLQRGPTVGPVGAQFPATTFEWTEVPKQP